ncbi:MAG: DinB family protein [Desulfobacterales bacterium]
MSQRAKDLSRRLEMFAAEVASFVEDLSGDDWKRVCKWEEWTVGDTARHIGAGHFAISDFIGKMANGEALPQLTMDQVNAMSKKDVEEHSGCTQAEALRLLRENGADLAAFIAGLSDDQLDRKASMPAFGGEVTTEQFIDAVLFQSGGQHFESMKTAVGK